MGGLLCYGSRNMDDLTLTEMALDELWALHERVVSILASRLETQKRELEDRLRQLSAAVAPDLVKEPSRLRSPAVPSKFRNPAEPHQTWSGRGKRPHWVTELLHAGMSLQDLQISETTPRGPKGSMSKGR
jgi:DNA-binding protein H-NS